MPAATVSVIIAAYNAGPYLERAVASALAQTGVPVEVIVINDSSTDDTLARAKAMAATEPRIKVLENAVNSGPSATRNHGMRAAKGEWCAVLDADDAYLPDRLSRLLQAATQAGVDIIGDLPVYYDLAAGQAEPDQPAASGQTSLLEVADFLRPDPESGLDLGLMKPLLRRSLVTDGIWIYPEGTRHGEDFDLCISALRGGTSMALLREQMYLYSTRFGALTQAFSPGSVTPVNYHQVADNAATLLHDMQQKGDISARTETLLKQRMQKARRQNRIYGWSTLRRGEFRRWWRWLQLDPRNKGDMAAVIGQKLMLRRGLPQ